MNRAILNHAQKALYILISFVLIFAMTFSCSPTAYADNGNSGTGDGGTTGGASNFLYWDHFSADGTWDAMNLPNSYLNVDVQGAGTVYGTSHFNQDWYGYDTYWAACVRHRSSNNGFVSNKADTLSINGNWNTNSRLSSFFTCDEHRQFLPDGAGFYETEGTYGTKNGNIFKLDRDGSIMSAIWLDSSKMYQTYTYSNPRTKIVYFNNPDEPEESYSYLPKTSEWKYNNAPTSGTYHGITPPTGGDALNYSNEINVKVEDEVKTITVVCLAKDAPSSFAEAEQIANNPTSEYTVKGEPTVTYESLNLRNLSKEITYKGNIPANVQTKYRPFNINRQSYAELGDNGITSDFINGVKDLEGSVSNDQGISDNTPLNALDINNDTSFNVTLNQNLGMNSEYDWSTVPDPLANSTWEYSGSEYANGRVGDMTNITDGGTGIYRYNLEQNQSIAGSLSVDGEIIPVASFVYKDKEIPSNEALTKKPPFSGGDYQARFIYAGTYTLDNEKSSSYPLYWINTYTQSRFYEYGVEYQGVFNTSGISEAHLVSPTSSPSPSNNGHSHFSTDGLTQRGLYVGVSQNIYTQPVVTATWLVKTLAGDIS